MHQSQSQIPYEPLHPSTRGWFPPVEWLTTKGCIAAPWRVHSLWYPISLWIFPRQSLRIELIILDEYWLAKTKPVLGCLRKASFFIIRTDNLQWNFFSSLNNYLPTIYVNIYDLVWFWDGDFCTEWLIVWCWLLFCVESLSWVPLSVSTYSSVKDLLWPTFDCTRKVCLVLENLNYCLDNL